jgi:hypothetical protein
MMERRPRVDDFLKAIPRPQIRVPKPEEDFYVYEKVGVAFQGLREHLDGLRSNQGRLGYSAQNLMSDLTKAYIDSAQMSQEEEMAFLENDMEKLAEGFNGVSHEIAEGGNRFSKTLHQERHEAKLFHQGWSVIIGKTDEISDLLPWHKFKGNVQAYLYAYLDVETEWAKGVVEKLSSPMTTEEELELYRRYLTVASSIALQLSHHRHVPGYVINNAFGHWAAYTTKLRTVYGCIANVRRDYNLRLSNQRMINQMEMRLAARFGVVALEAK